MSMATSQKVTLRAETDGNDRFTSRQASGGLQDRERMREGGLPGLESGKRSCGAGGRSRKGMECLQG